MNAITPPPSRKSQHPALQGLGEKDLNAVFNNCATNVLAPASVLFRAGEPATADFLLLEGVAKLQNPRVEGREVVIVAGELVPGTLLQQDGVYTHDCVMATHGTVLVMEEKTRLAFDERLQLALHRNALPLTRKLMSHFVDDSPRSHNSPQVDVERVHQFLGSKQAVYDNATALRTMLASLPRLPAYSSQLTTVLNDPQANTRMVVDIARQDPSLTAAVLKTINSPFYGFTHKIRDFQHAVIMLGFSQLQQLLIGVGIQSVMPNTAEFRQLQAHSMMISVLANEISLTLKAGSAPLLGTLGILHDIGKSIVLLLRHQHAKHEFLMNLLDADMVGTLLLREWKLAENISDALQYQSYPTLLPASNIPDAHRVNVAVLYLAHCCLERLSRMQSSAPLSPFHADYMHELGCGDGNVDDFIMARLIPFIEARRSVLPAVLQDLLKKAALGGP